MLVYVHVCYLRTILVSKDHDRGRPTQPRNVGGAESEYGLALPRQCFILQRLPKPLFKALSWI
jgi:hypothetical protein